MGGRPDLREADHARPREGEMGQSKSGRAALSGIQADNGTLLVRGGHETTTPPRLRAAWHPGQRGCSCPPAAGRRTRRA